MYIFVIQVAMTNIVMEAEIPIIVISRNAKLLPVLLVETAISIQKNIRVRDFLKKRNGSTLFRCRNYYNVMIVSQTYVLRVQIQMAKWYHCTQNTKTVTTV